MSRPVSTNCPDSMRLSQIQGIAVTDKLRLLPSLNSLSRFVSHSVLPLCVLLCFRIVFLFAFLLLNSVSAFRFAHCSLQASNTENWTLSNEVSNPASERYCTALSFVDRNGSVKFSNSAGFKISCKRITNQVIRDEINSSTPDADDF